MDRHGQLPRYPRGQKPKLPKYGIYLIKYRQRIIRVGESSSGFERLRKGFQADFKHEIRRKVRKNYIAYHWRTKYKSRLLVVDYFSLSADPFRKDSLRRALEAEVTFQLRVANGAWPVHMNEIHFREEDRRKSHLIARAAEILKVYDHAYKDL